MAERRGSAPSHGPSPARVPDPSGVSTVRHVLAQSWVWLCLVAVLGTYVAVMRDRGAPWRGDLIWTIDWLPIGFILAGPLVAGFVAVDTGRLAVGVRGLPHSRGRTFDLPVAFTYALALVSLHLLFTVGTLVVSRPSALDPAAGLAVLAQLVMLVFFVALGSFVGRFAPVVLGGLAAALAALAAVYLFSAPGDTAGLLYAGAATTPRLGYEYNAGWLVAQVLALAALVVTSWAVRGGGSPGPRWRSVAAGLLVVGTAVGGSAALAAVPGERLEPNGAGPDACGALAGVPWCYYRQHERAIGPYASNLLALFEAADAQGYAELVPDRVMEADQRTWPGDATTGAFYITPEGLAGEDPLPWETALRLVEPVHCPQLAGEIPPAQRYWDDLEALTATWVGLVDPTLPEQFGYTVQPLSPERAAEVVRGFRMCTYPFV